MIPELPEHLSQSIEAKHLLFMAGFELTNKCNLKCLHCYNLPRKDKELTTEEVKSIFAQLAKEGCLFLGLSGGEPLTRKDFWELAHYAKEKAFALTIKTNGMLITPTVADKFKELHPWQVHISLLGADARTHDEVTGVPGSFTRAIQAVQLLKERKITLYLMTSLLKQNVRQYKAMQELAEFLGVEHFTSPLIFPQKNGGEVPANCRPREADLEKYYYAELVRKNAPIRPPQENKSFICQAGRTSLSINAWGEVFPCAVFPLPLGDLRRQSLAEILATSENVRRIRTLKTEDFSECATCAEKSICGRCLAFGYLEKRDLLATPRECCRITQLERRWFYHGKAKAAQKVY